MKKIDIGPYITVNNRGETLRIPLERILYVSQRERRVLIKTDEREIFTYGKITEMEKDFDERFNKILKYTLVNYERVRLFCGQAVYFDNGDFYTLCRTNYSKAKSEYTAYIKGLSHTEES